MHAQKIKPEIDFKRVFMVHRQGKNKLRIVAVNIVLPLKCEDIRLNKEKHMLCHHPDATKIYCTPQHCPRIESAKLYMLQAKGGEVYFEKQSFRGELKRMKKL